jgi:hypothetical protein
MKEQGSGNRDQGSGINDQFRWRTFAGPALILLSAFVAIVPEVVRGPSCGHDFDFHLVSWIDALHSWRHGILYPHWTPTPNFEAGEPRFIFYPPLTWMLGAMLRIIVPWRFVPRVMTFLLLAGTGLATRALARQRFGDGVSTVAGCASLFSGYTLFTAYERAAFAEMTGGFWVPMMLMLLLGASDQPQNLRAPSSRFFSIARVGDHDSRPAFFFALDRTTLLLALIVAGAWLSNAPLGVMLSYLLAGVSLFLAFFDKSWILIFRAAVASALGLGLSAFFWIPAAWEQRWVAIRQAVDDPGLLIENSWLFARHSDPRLELHDVELLRVSIIAVTMVAVALAGAGVSWWRRALPHDRRWWLPLVLIPVAVLFLQLPVSDFLWNALPKMRFLQFPWRWLVVLEAPMAIFFATAVWTGGRLWRGLVTVGCCAVFAGATLFATVSLFQSCDEDDEVKGVLRSMSQGTGVEGTDEYAPLGADNSLIPTGLPFACLVPDPARKLGRGDPDMTPDWSPDQGSCDAVYAAAGGSLLHVRMQADTPHAGYLVLRLRTYPAWRVTVNGQRTGQLPVREDGLMAVPVPGGHVQVAADWTTTPDILIGRLVSLTALVVITLLWLLDRRRMQAQLS